MKNGFIQIYTGEGKGKTTAAIGLAIRAAGNNLKVIIVQFLKGEDSGEIYAIKKNMPQIGLYSFNSQKKFLWHMTEAEILNLKEESKKGVLLVKDILESASCDILVLDEIIGAINQELIPLEDLVELLKNRTQNVEIILTGRNAPIELINLASLVTEMKNIKHPFDVGVKARVGIEK